MYSNGDSERTIGRALKNFDIPRSKVVIFTKCGGAVGEDPGLRTHVHKARLQLARNM